MNEPVMQKGIFTLYPCVDRNGVPLAPDQTIRVKHCVGRYGQTRIVEGTLVQIGQYKDIYLILGPNTEPFREDQGRFGSTTRKAGDLYLCYALEFDRKEKVMRGFYRHDDFEHGHECWVEVMKKENE